MTTALLIGRYQPFHKGHLEVVKQILKDCDHLTIGIGSSQYSKTEENPFSYEERREMIEGSLNDENISNSKYELVAVPDIHDDEKWVAHVIDNCPHFDIVYTQNPHTKKLFENAKIQVRGQPLFNVKKYKGTRIRKLIIKEGNWKDSVTPSVAKAIEVAGGVERLKSILGTD